MSDRWEVNWVREDGNIPLPVSDFDRQFYQMATTDIGREGLEFVTELVHEIERLQTENINLKGANVNLFERLILERTGRTLWRGWDEEE